MIRKQNLTALILAISLLASCANIPNYKTGMGTHLLYNQVSYISKAPKMVLVSTQVNTLDIFDSNNKKVVSITPNAPLYWEQSGDSVRKADISAITLPGIYTIVLPDVEEKYEIEVSDNPYTPIAKAAIKALYFNRTAVEISESLGGPWARPAGHPDTIVLIHSSAAEKHRPEGTVISSPLGWYDAGDYNKYIVNSGISTYTMFKALSDYPEYFTNLEADIPETGSGVPDILSETLFNYRWMLTMQDPHDGGVYHKLTNKNFDGVIMPHEGTDERYVVMKTTAAALNFAAVAAKAYRVLGDYKTQFPGLAAESIEKAEKAWQWALNNPDVYYRQPEDIQTGTYGDNNVTDEFFWAAAELYRATGKEMYLETVLEKYSKPTVPTWNQVYALGFLTLLEDYDNLPQSLKDKGIREDFLELANHLTSVSQTSPYGVSIQHFEWGSNSAVANQGILKLLAYKLTGDKNHLYSAHSDMDYLLGRNATGYCFVTGFGNQKVMNIHHRPSEADGIEDPVPGFLAGGPNTATFDDCPDMERSTFPAKSFVDHWCSYSTNEIAINWNTPLVYLAGALDAHSSALGQ